MNLRRQLHTSYPYTEDMSSKRMRVSDPLTNNIRFEEFQSRDILASTKFSPERIGNQVKHVLEPTNTIPRRIVIRPLPDIPEQFLSPTWSTQISQPDSSPFNASDNIQTSPIQLSNISLFPNFMTPTDLNEAMLDNPDMMLMTRSDNCDTFSNISNKKKRKRKKMSFKEDNRLGYKEDLEIFFLWMLYNQNFWECVPESHILNKAVKVSSEKHIPLLVENILKSKTGVELAAVTSETLIGLPRFTELLSDLVSCWNRLSLSHLIEAHCAKPGRNKNAIYYAIDKCIFPIEQVELLMNYVPATEQIFCNINKITNEDEVGDRKSTISGISKTAAYLNLSKDLSSNVHDSQYLKHCKETLSDIYKTGTKDYGKTVNTSAKKILLFDKSRNEHFPKESIKENNISSMEKTLQDFEILSETIDLVMQDQNNAISVTPLDWNLVYCLIKSVMHQVIPIQLVGSKKNFRLLEKAVKILMLCGRNDKFYIGQLMRNIKISDFKWAANLHTFHHRTYVICKLWIWLLRNIVMAVLRSFFYITESSVTRKQLLYYRKREWQKKHDQALAHLVSNGALLNLSRDALRQLTQGVICQSDKGNKLKRPRLRFLPKVQGVRPIMPTRLCGMNTSTKKHAKILLSYLIEKRESGSIRVNASKGMHKVWQSYIRSFKNHTDKESLYFVRVVELM
ncbi:unnamed protein product [Meganyctiphanes norvegica]|uniref:Telomerase reverse transcriptase n=1 Tax=Meganyctiphanes norvegica TaxID=48144 RepID=A0AAV2QZF3_MEGNR